MSKTKKTGKPKFKQKELANDVTIPVRVNAADRKLFEKVAKETNYKTLSAWIRETLLTGAYRRTR